MSTAKRVANHYREQNEQAARLILSDIQRHGDDSAGLVVWARAFLERMERERVAQIGPLFERAA